MRAAGARPQSLLAWSAAGMPLAVAAAVDPSGWFPFGPAKWLAVSVIVALLVIGLGCTVAVRLPRVLVAIWCAFLALLTLAAVFGQETWYAWTGTPERHLGLLTWLLFLVAFVAGCQLTRAGVDWVARGMALAAVWTGGYAVVEHIWRAPLAVATDSSRLTGPFGSAAYLGAATCLLVPVATAVAVDERHGARWRAVGGVGALTCLVAAVGSGARAAWLGLGVAACLALVAGGRTLLPARRILAMAGAGLAIAVTTVAPVVPDVVERTAGAASRLDEWRIAAKMTVHNPLLGVGPEGYRVAFAGEVDAAYELTYGRIPQPDRAHSGPLDVATSGGIPAAVLYVLLLILIAWSAVAVVRRHVTPTTSGVAIAAIAYLGQQLLLFPLAELDPTFWIAAGVTVAASGRFGERRVSTAGARRMAIVGAGSVLFAAAATAGIVELAADRLARRAFDTSDPVAAAAAAERAASLRPDVVRYHLLAAEAHRASGTLRGTDDAIAATARALAISPGEPIARERRAAALLARAEMTGAADDVRRALEAYTALAGDDPVCFECQLGLGRVRALDGDAIGAEEAFRRAAELSHRDDRPAAWIARLHRQQGRG